MKTAAGARRSTGTRLLTAAVLALAGTGCHGPSAKPCERTGDRILHTLAADSAAVYLPTDDDWLNVGLALDTGPFGSWDTVMEGVTPAAVVRRDGKFLLYYVGAPDYNPDLRNIGPIDRAIGVATSDDGVRWTKYGENPVIRFSSSGNHEEGAVSMGITQNPHGTLLAYYGANVADDPRSPLVNADVRLATSTDGFRFEPAGRVIDHRDASVWGNGDEIHATLALRHEGSYHVYYVPNGTPESGTLGYCRGGAPDSLHECGPVTDGSGPLRSAGSSSVVQLGDDVFAFVVSDRGTLNVYLAAGECLTSFGEPVRQWEVGSGSVVTLDRERRTWFLYTNRWSHLDLRVARAGPEDATPPTPPGEVRALETHHDRVELGWEKASDPETGVLWYEVYRDGRRLGRTLERSFADSLLTEDTVYEYEVRATNLHGREGPGRTLSVRTALDSVPPAIQSVTTRSPSEILVTFDEPIELVGSGPAATFSLAGGATVHAAEPGEDPDSVLLNVDRLPAGSVQELGVHGIRDRSRAGNEGEDARSFTVSAQPGLVALWTMDDPSAPGTDRSGSAHHATVVGTVRVSEEEPRGIRLTGGEYLELDPPRALRATLLSDFTVVAWVRPAQLPPRTDNTNDAYTIVSGPGRMRLQYRFDGAFVAALGRPGDEARLESQPFPPRVWHCVAMVVQPSRQRLSLFVNGQPVAGSPLFGPEVRLEPAWESPNYSRYHGRLRIGVRNPRFAFESAFFRGELNRVRIHRGALSTDDVLLACAAP